MPRPVAIVLDTNGPRESAKGTGRFPADEKGSKHTRSRMPLPSAYGFWENCSIHRQHGRHRNSRTVLPSDGSCHLPMRTN